MFSKLIEYTAQRAEYKKLGAFHLVFSWFFVFNLMEALVEKFIFGEAFYHQLDPFFIAGFLVLSVRVFQRCDLYQRQGSMKEDS